MSFGSQSQAPAPPVAPPPPPNPPMFGADARKQKPQQQATTQFNASVLGMAPSASQRAGKTLLGQ